jgi:dihydrofolate synthase/folylpolyglutamate synthase
MKLIYNALLQVQKITGLQGRWQVIQDKPLVIADTGHNEDGIKEVLENLKRYNYKTLHFV